MNFFWLTVVVETGSHHAAWLETYDPPASASRVLGYRHAPSHLVCNQNFYTIKCIKDDPGKIHYF
jgi:hypothetical protein